MHNTNRPLTRLLQTATTTATTRQSLPETILAISLPRMETGQLQPDTTTHRAARLRVPRMNPLRPSGEHTLRLPPIHTATPGHTHLREEMNELTLARYRTEANEGRGKEESQRIRARAKRTHAKRLHNSYILPLPKQKIRAILRHEHIEAHIAQHTTHQQHGPTSRHAPGRSRHPHQGDRRNATTPRDSLERPPPRPPGGEKTP